jgi:hypothetical protein
MTKNYLNSFLAGAGKTVLAAAAVLLVFTGTVVADNINLDMEGTTATVPKGNTINRKIFGIPKIGGTLKLRFKWHAVNIIPNTFNPLKLEVLHGSTVLTTKNGCYSTHANKTPKCDLNLNVSQAEAEKTGNWTIRVTNNSNDEVIAFNIEKGSDVNPMVPNFKSIYTPNCPNTVNLDMEGTTLTLGKGNTQERKINRIGALNGDVRLRMKWHAVNILPTFNALKVEVMNGSNVIQTKTCYSIHSNQSAKCDFTFTSGNRPANQWKLRVTNNSNFEVMGFNIEKESGDINPLVPNFKSTYKAKCP